MAFLGEKCINVGALRHKTGGQSPSDKDSPGIQMRMLPTAFELLRVILVCRELQIPYFILGGGSNLLVGDKGFRGMVVANRKGRIVPIGDNRLEIESGVKNLTTVDFLCRTGLSGLEFLVGIPGTMGGAVRSNAHFRSIEAFGEGVSDFKTAKNCFVHDWIEAVLILNAEKPGHQWGY